MDDDALHALRRQEKRYSENRWKLENGDFVLAPTN